MKPVFKEYNQGQTMLFPVSLDSKIAQDSPVRLVNQVVDNLDISKVIDTYKGGGTSAYPPRVMLKLVIFAYLSNIYSSRKIEAAIIDRFSFAWLAGGLEPDHNTVNRFRSNHLKNTVNEIFTQVVVMLVEMGYLSLDVAYIDGTKIESRANRYTFVWRKTVEKNKAKLEAKIRKVLEYIDEGIMQDNQPDGEPPTPINSEELKKRIAEINASNKIADRPKEAQKEIVKAIKILEEKQLPKLAEYENHLETLGNRNSYSKTDTSATFMHLKDDHMQNGQLKPAYNLQIGTENQFISHFDFFSNPADFLTFKPFVNGFRERFEGNFGKVLKKAIADSGYGSEENYEFMEANEIEPFVKFPMFHKEQKRAFKNNAFLAQNLFYNKEKDFFVCPIGQRMEKVGEAKRKTDSGFISFVSHYEARNCEGCPLKCLCHKAKGNRRIEVNHNLNRHKEKVRQLLTSKEGLYHRRRRPIEPESVFGQGKSNKNYFRFRHFGKELITMDFAVFAIAFNIGKLYNKGKITPKNRQKLPVLSEIVVFAVVFYEKYKILLQKENYYTQNLKLAA
ncbi:MAG: IS1182 family transposase [Prevotellaceae bacterium]|jgi:transposase|nr:IS1182 family transposase [Prevotellaceae bacterium]